MYELYSVYSVYSMYSMHGMHNMYNMHSVNIMQCEHYAQYVQFPQYAQYAHYTQHKLRYIIPIYLLLSINQSTHKQQKHQISFLSIQLYSINTFCIAVLIMTAVGRNM